MSTPLRILIVEDSEDDAQLLLRELRSGDYEPIFERVETREALVAALKRQKWDIITADFTMPHFSSPEALTLLRERGLDIPFIIVSGTIGEDTAVEAMKAGANDYIMKSNLKRLVPAIGRELREMEIRRKQREAERALRESEAKYRTLVEKLQEGVYQTDLEGNYITLNKTGATIFGFDSPEQIIGKYKTIDLYYDPSERAVIIQDMKNTGYCVREVRVKRRDGSSIWMLANNNARLDENGNIIGYEGVFTDITEHKNAEEGRRQSTEKLVAAMEATIEAMAMTVEMRDPYTAGHQRRVTELALAIAKELGLSDAEINGIRLAGIVHDIGKMQIPAEILSKPGRLTELEFSMIKNHPSVGYEILKHVEFPWPVAKIVLQHHERMDGSGYPSGISGSDILLEARILGVADVVEAMASHRPYRPALGTGQALNEISKNSAILYDPKVVDACYKLFYEKGFKLD
jgi:PAS domain S-box-containing protein/putative nucleotidyltransferase with HDIG domain